MIAMTLGALQKYENLLSYWLLALIGMLELCHAAQPSDRGWPGWQKSAIQCVRTTYDFGNAPIKDETALVSFAIIPYLCIGWKMKESSSYISSQAITASVLANSILIYSNRGGVLSNCLLASWPNNPHNTQNLFIRLCTESSPWCSFPYPLNFFFNRKTSVEGVTLLSLSLPLDFQRINLPPWIVVDWTSFILGGQMS